MSRVEESETRGTYACPICGYDKPHGHSEETVKAYHNDQIRADGWTSCAVRMPKEFGYYLIKDFKFPESSIRGAYIKELSNWRRPTWGEAPEVAEYHPSDSGWFQLLYKPVLNDRFAAGFIPVLVAPKFWRPLP